MRSCLVDDTYITTRRHDGEPARVSLDYFGPLFDDDGSGSIDGIEVLSRAGWTVLTAVGRRRLWEDEQLYQILTRAGRLTLTGEQRVVLLRAGEEAVLPAQEVRAGDALLVREQPRLGKKAPPIDSNITFRSYGVLSVDCVPGNAGYLYHIETEDKMLIANDVLVQCV